MKEENYYEQEYSGDYKKDRRKQSPKSWETGLKSSDGIQSLEFGNQKSELRVRKKVVIYELLIYLVVGTNSHKNYFSFGDDLIKYPYIAGNPKSAVIFLHSPQFMIS